MLLPEFLEELFYTSNINLFESPFSVGSIQRIDPNFKFYLKKVYDYTFLATQKWLSEYYKDYTIKELKNIQRLDLAGNQLTEIPNFNLPNLETLFLSYNHLIELPNLNLPNLLNLYLHHNQLIEFPKLNLPNLQELVISNNQITELSTLKFINLKLLDLTHNPLTEQSKEYLKSLNIDIYY